LSCASLGRPVRAAASVGDALAADALVDPLAVALEVVVVLPFAAFVVAAALDVAAAAVVAAVAGLPSGSFGRFWAATWETRRAEVRSSVIES